MSCRAIRWVVCAGLLGLVATTGIPTAKAQSGSDSWYPVTVTTIEGTVYEDVSVTWGLEGFSLIITAADGTETQLRPSQVETITDDQGTDITNAVAAAGPAEGEATPLIGDHKIHPFEFRWMLAVGGSGTMYKAGGGFEPGGAIYGGARLGLGTQFHVHLLYRRQPVTEPVHSLGGEISSNANELHFLLGFRTNHPRENNNYLYVELGLAAVQFEDRFNEEREAWNDQRGTAMGATAQGGVVFALSPRWGLDLGGILMFRPTLIEDSADPGLLFGINLGLAYRW